MPRNSIKPILKGRVTEVGHRLSDTGQSTEVYALVEVKLTYLRGTYEERAVKAEERLRQLSKQVLGQPVDLKVK